MSLYVKMFSDKYVKYIQTLIPTPKVSHCKFLVVKGLVNVAYIITVPRCVNPLTPLGRKTGSTYGYKFP